MGRPAAQASRNVIPNDSNADGDANTSNDANSSALRASGTSVSRRTRARSSSGRAADGLLDLRRADPPRAGDHEARARHALPHDAHRGEQVEQALVGRHLPEEAHHRLGRRPLRTGRQAKRLRVDARGDDVDAGGIHAERDDVVGLVLRVRGVGGRGADGAADDVAVEAPVVVRVEGPEEHDRDSADARRRRRHVHVRERERRRRDDVGRHARGVPRHAGRERALVDRAHDAAARQAPAIRLLLHAVEMGADDLHDAVAADAYAVLPRLAVRELGRAGMPEVGGRERRRRAHGHRVAVLRDESARELGHQRLGAADRGRVAVTEVEDAQGAQAGAVTRRSQSEPGSTPSRKLGINSRSRAGCACATAFAAHQHLPLAVVDQERLHEVLLGPEMRARDMRSRVVARQEDVVEVHDDARRDERQEVEHDAVDVAADLDGVRRVDEQDVVRLERLDHRAVDVLCGDALNARAQIWTGGHLRGRIRIVGVERSRTSHPRRCDRAPAVSRASSTRCPARRCGRAGSGAQRRTAVRRRHSRRCRFRA